jgi:hypothetical protein
MSEQKKSELTQRQRYIIKWIDENEHHRARWMREGKAAFGPHETWDAFEISGYEKRIRIKRGDFKAILPFVETTSEQGRMFKSTLSPEAP